MLQTITRRLAITLLIAIFSLVGCATQPKISQDFKLNTEFKQLNTFKWRNFSSEIPTSNHDAIKNTLTQMLITQGFQPATDNADMMIDISMLLQARAPSSTGIGLSIGLPIGNHGSIGLGTSQLLSQSEQQQGLIIMDITEQASNQVIWRGTAEAIPMNYFLLRNQQQLNSALQKLVSQFPPR